jgi:hypothetical protein
VEARTRTGARRQHGHATKGCTCATSGGFDDDRRDHGKEEDVHEKEGNEDDNDHALEATKITRRKGQGE